jgi:hypothetical protein
MTYRNIGNPTSLRHAIGAVPDALTALAFLTCWVAPGLIGYEWVWILMLALPVEFLAIQAVGLMFSAANADASRVQRLRSVLGYGLPYVLVTAAIAFAVEDWWPLGVMVWLVLGKCAVIWLDRRPDADERARQRDLWALSVIAYFGLAVAVFLVWLPDLGIDAAARAALPAAAGSFWRDVANEVIAFGFAYFATLAVAKAGLLPRPRWFDWISSNDPV